MKKILSILGTISLSTIISTNIIACNSTNKKNIPNKPITPQFTPQQPPTNSNGKLIDKSNFKNENDNENNKGYILIAKQSQNDNFSIMKFNFSSELIGKIGQHGGHRINNRGYVYINSLYRGDSTSEPQTPTIDKTTGKIINGN